MTAPLYANAARDRYFWIPDGEAPPAGEHVLAGLDGRTVSVSDEALDRYEVPEERARAVIADQLRDRLRQGADALKGLAEAARSAGSGVPGADRASRVADALGVDDLKDPRAALAALQATLDDVMAALDGQGDPAAAVEKWSKLGRVQVDAATGPTEEAVRGVAEDVRRVLTDPQDLGEARETLQAAIDKLRKG